MSIRAAIIAEAGCWGLSPADLPQYVGTVGRRIKLSLLCIKIGATKPLNNHGFRSITFADGDVNIIHYTEFSRMECQFEEGQRYEFFATPTRHFIHYDEKCTQIAKIKFVNT